MLACSSLIENRSQAKEVGADVESLLRESDLIRGRYARVPTTLLRHRYRLASWVKSQSCIDQMKCVGDSSDDDSLVLRLGASSRSSPCSQCLSKVVGTRAYLSLIKITLPQRDSTSAPTSFAWDLFSMRLLQASILFGTTRRLKGTSSTIFLASNAYLRYGLTLTYRTLCDDHPETAAKESRRTVP